MSTSSLLQWDSTQWPSLLGGGRSGQACLVVPGEEEEDDAGGNKPKSVLVLGGNMNCGSTNSVLVWDPSTKRWRYGPSLSSARHWLAAAVCDGAVYAIGGHNRFTLFLNTIERIHFSTILDPSNSTQANQWTTMFCRMSSPRLGCAAAVLHNRYIVIMGGHSGIARLATVDIVDTVNESVIAGANMNTERANFGAHVIGNRIFVAGGYDQKAKTLSSVESLSFHDSNDNLVSTSCAKNIFPKSSFWKVEPTLALSIGRAQHAMAKVGSCLVVAGGTTTGMKEHSVEVLDVQRYLVWSLPNMKVARVDCSMITLLDCLVVLGGIGLVDSVESIAMTAFKREHFKSSKCLYEQRGQKMSHYAKQFETVAP